MTDLAFYTNPMSRGRIARWMLEETGCAYDTHVVEFGPAMHGGTYKAVNPMAKVPAIRHRGVVVTEAAAICAYLADAFPEAGLAPDVSSPDRGAYYRWLFFAAGPIEHAVVNESFGWKTSDPMERGRTGYGSLGRVCRTLDAHLSDGRTWLLGDTFTAADVYLGAQIAWGLQFETIPEQPSFKSYAGRLVSRPAAVRAREKDEALMKKEA
jgi:glutathione S-transferase